MRLSGPRPCAGGFDMIKKSQIVDWLREVGNVIEKNADYLTELDAAIGDADHGINMDRGFKKVVSGLKAAEEKDIGTVLNDIGMALISSVGGASGPLYGTFFIRAGRAARGKHELGTADLAAVLRAGLEGLAERGRARQGDKTMIDTLLPCVEAIEKAAGRGHNTDEALRRAVEAAEQGMKDTVPMTARKGRASYLGRRSIGHQDPGATSSYLIIKALQDTVS